MSAPLSPERLAEIREREEAATKGPWEPGDVWLLAGTIYSATGDRVGGQRGTRCAFCHLGEPSWSGRTGINGTVMRAHRHRDPDPRELDHVISAADGGLIAGPYDYDSGGIIRREDTVFTVHARQDVPGLLAEVDRLTARVAELEAAPSRADVIEEVGAWLHLKGEFEAAYKVRYYDIPGEDESPSPVAGRPVTAADVARNGGAR